LSLASASVKKENEAQKSLEREEALKEQAMQQLVDMLPGKVSTDVEMSEAILNKANTEDIAKNSGLQEYINQERLDKCIQTGNWDKQTLNEIENLINEIENGTVTYKRFPQETSRGLSEGGRILQAASILLRGKTGTDEENTRSLTVGERFQRDQRQQPIQERIIESWAKATGVWYDSVENVTKSLKHLSDYDGGEAMIFADDKDNIIKLISTEYFITPQFALDRIVLHNALFPESKMVLKGFTRDKDGISVLS